jgi:heme exporter protein D
MNLYWSSWSEFLAMGGYGLYVWGSFGVTAAVMLADVLALRARHRTLMRENRDNAEFEGISDET